MNSVEIEPIMDLGQIPFHIGVANTPSNEDFPDLLPFSIGIRSGIGLLVQLPNETVRSYLEQVYRKGSIVGTPVTDEGFGRRYADDFLSFVCNWFQPRNARELRVLEIGCGSGYLLHRLKELGADVLGVEPGEYALMGREKYNIEIVHDSFPNQEVSSAGPFDVVIHHGVLEHLEDPAFSLEMQARCLTDSGVIIFAVPDCREYILKGDVSMFLHEHWSYFSPSSLKSLLESVGLCLLCWNESRFGGVLHVVGGKKGKPVHGLLSRDGLDLFRERVENGIRNTKLFFDEAVRDRRSIGIFCPARIANLLALVHPRQMPRFFDDDARLTGKYYPPMEVPVESRASLLIEPVDELIIMSRSFGTGLKSELSSHGPLGKTRIRLASELMGQ